MILADTSVWIEHLRSGNAKLEELLEARQILAHPFVTGELSLGNLHRRHSLLKMLEMLPQALVAHEAEVLQLIDRHRLFGLGIGYIDAHLLAAVRLTPGTQLWTLDKRFRTVADRFSLHVDLPHGPRPA